jgi:hypothetical protein
MMPRLIIKEAILNLDESDLACELYAQMIDSHGWEKGHWTSQSNLAYCIYITSRSGPTQGVLFQFVQDEKFYPMHFHRLLTLSQPQSLLDAQFLIEFYRRYFQDRSFYSKKGLSPWEALTEMNFKPNTLLDGLLADTRGLIMWDYQYDQMLQFIGPDWNDPPDMRLRLGLQSGRLWREYQQAKINKRRLQEMIKERAIFGSTRAPSLPGALTLWKALNESSYN